MLVAIEGIDASGKATQSKLLAEYLGKQGFADPRVVSFPNYSTRVGQIVKDILESKLTLCSDGRALRVPLSEAKAYVLQSLLTSDRFATADNIVIWSTYGALVCDRYWLSGVVYGTDDGVDPEWLMNTLKHLPEPDLWLFLDVPMDEVGRRLRARCERDNRPLDLYERNMEKLGRIRESYLKHFRTRDFLSRTGTSAKIVDGTGTVEEVHARIVDACAFLMP